ncbi:MAG: hypothetical protein JW791_03135 [Nanoarchaeota archaeon]|nr:hypothetical protein [Nanoarchaeota archaeon]
MRKAISPVISVILLIVMTIGAAALAFFWITSVQSNIQETVGGNVEGSAGRDCSRLNLISIRGDGAIVQNVGCDTISSVNFFINGVLTSYDLEQPLAPGQAATINYLKQTAGEDLTVMVVLDNGVKSSLLSPADYNTPQSGFTNAELKYYETSFEEAGDWMGNITDDYAYTGTYSITFDIDASTVPGLYPFELEEIVYVSFYSYIPSGDYTGYQGPFFVYFDIVSLEEPQEVYYEYLYMYGGAGNEGYFNFFYYEVGAP